MMRDDEADRRLTNLEQRAQRCELDDSALDAGMYRWLEHLNTLSDDEAAAEVRAGFAQDESADLLADFFGDRQFRDDLMAKIRESHGWPPEGPPEQDQGQENGHRLEKTPCELTLGKKTPQRVRERD